MIFANNELPSYIMKFRSLMRLVNGPNFRDGKIKIGLDNEWGLDMESAKSALERLKADGVICNYHYFKNT